MLHAMFTALFVRAPKGSCYMPYVQPCLLELLHIMLHVLCTALFIRAPTGSCYMSCVLPCLLELLQDHVTCFVYCHVY